MLTVQTVLKQTFAEVDINKWRLGNNTISVAFLDRSLEMETRHSAIIMQMIQS